MFTCAAREASYGRRASPIMGPGLATLPAIARIMRDTKLETRSSILFVADVGEEGEGNLRGVRKLVENYRKQLRYVIALDGASIDYVTTAAFASRRVEITITGPGGHSWSDFGVPNPIDALARGIALFVKTPAPDSPRTTFNIGSIEGGTSVNSIPAKASIKVDLRSEAEPEIPKLENALRRAIQNGVDEEMQAARDRGMAAAPALSIDTKVLGVRPGGELRRILRFSRPCKRPTNTWVIGRAWSDLPPTPIFRFPWAFPRSPWGPEEVPAARIRFKNGTIPRAARLGCSELLRYCKWRG